MKVRGAVLLIIAALVWGFAFVVQSVGGKEVGAHTFNGLRMFLSAVFMLPAIFYSDRKGNDLKPKTKADWKHLWIYGIVCGFFLAAGTNLQQIALNAGAEAGRAGFITALYILMVPLIGLFLKKKLGWNIWVGVAVAVIGMYFLCINGAFAISLPDLILILCALAFSLHIIVVDLTGNIDPLRLSSLQFFFCGIFSMILAVIFEIVPHEGGFFGWASFFGTSSFWLMTLYMAIFSGCIGYTLQVIGQRSLSPTIASLIMSLESVFSVVFGYLVLHEELTGRQLFGCGLIFAAIIVAQIEFRKKQVQ